VTAEPANTGVAARAAAPAERRPLSRELIIETAIAMVDAEGVQRLTMRRLGRQLDVEAMSLYRYVNGREDLLEGLVAHLVATITVDPEEDGQPAPGWQGLMQWLAHSVRALALAHPNVFPLIATRDPAASWLRPPLRSLRVGEEFLDALMSRGFNEQQAVRAYRSFTSFLLGHLLLEVATLGAETSPVGEPLDEGDAQLSNTDQDLDLDRYPMVQRLRPLLSEDHTDAEFEQALESLLDRMDLELSP
jgi:AcrR family transcriptional regulator